MTRKYATRVSRTKEEREIILEQVPELIKIMSVRKMAEHLKVATNTIYSYIEKQGIKIPKRGRSIKKIENLILDENLSRIENIRIFLLKSKSIRSISVSMDISTQRLYKIIHDTPALNKLYRNNKTPFIKAKNKLKRLLKMKFSKKQLCWVFNATPSQLRRSIEYYNYDRYFKPPHKPSSFGFKFIHYLANTPIYRNHKQQLKLYAKWSFWNKKRLNCTNNNIEFSLPFEEDMYPDVCPVFGTRLIYGDPSVSRHNRPSFDKVVPAKGYTRENVCIISFKANFLKNNASLDDIKRILSYIKKSLRSKNKQCQ